jgi:hypothetical protein
MSNNETSKIVPVLRHHDMKTYGGVKKDFHTSKFRNFIDVSAEIHDSAVFTLGKETAVAVG